VRSSVSYFSSLPLTSLPYCAPGTAASAMAVDSPALSVLPSSPWPPPVQTQHAAMLLVFLGCTYAKRSIRSVPAASCSSLPCRRRRRVSTLSSIPTSPSPPTTTERRGSFPGSRRSKPQREWTPEATARSSSVCSASPRPRYSAAEAL
jgi:hypothetical protein